MWRTPTIPVADSGARPLTIVHVITRLVRGGAEENTIATCLHQAANGHRVTLVHGPGADPSWAARFGDRIRFRSVDSLVHPIRPVADVAAIRDLLRLYRQLHADVVHTHESKAGIVGRIAAAFARVPLIVHTIHIAPFVAVSGPKRLLYLEAERACARFSNLLIAVSRGMQRAYLDGRIGGDVPIPVIHSGMQLDRSRLPLLPTTGAVEWADGMARTSPRFILKTAAFEGREAPAAVASRTCGRLARARRHLPALRRRGAGSGALRRGGPAPRRGKSGPVPWPRFRSCELVALGRRVRPRSGTRGTSAHGRPGDRRRRAAGRRASAGDRGDHYRRRQRNHHERRRFERAFHQAVRLARCAGPAGPAPAPRAIDRRVVVERGAHGRPDRPRLCRSDRLERFLTPANCSHRVPRPSGVGQDDDRARADRTASRAAGAGALQR